MSKPTPEERHEAAMKAKSTRERNKAQWEALTAAKAAAKQKDNCKAAFEIIGVRFIPHWDCTSLWRFINP